MSESVQKLVEALIGVSDDSVACAGPLPANLQESYRNFLSLCDGGYTADHFFHFFGLRGPREHNLLAWNETGLWKRYYDLDETTFVFAEDILGTQFCFDVRGNRRVVKMFRPSSGRLSLCANTFEEFVEDEVLRRTADAQIRELAENFFRAKQETFRPFTHIACKVPPALGGSDSDLNNLELIAASTNLSFLGQVASQVKHLEPGTRIGEIRMVRDKGEKG